jgi:predicted amidohydrolase
MFEDMFEEENQQTFNTGPKIFRVGLVQMRSGRDVERNLIDSVELIRAAARGGAQYVQTPEVTTLIEADRAKMFLATYPEEGNPALAHYRALAREIGIWLHIGSMGIRVGADKIANRAFLIAPTGAINARYDKIHMFDVDLPGGENYRESKYSQAGDAAVLAALPWGVLGISICYDLRFPQLYRALAQAGADFLAAPSAFTKQTGEAHWHALIRARAVENGCFVFAAAQGGKHESGRETYGHSIIAAPWGDILAEGDTHPAVIFADIRVQDVHEARRRIPSLRHDRAFKVVGESAKGRAREHT